MGVFACRTTYRNLNYDLRNALDALGYRPSRQRILLKPCLSAHRRSIGIGAWTSRNMVEAFVRLFPEHEFTIAEGVPAGQDFQSIVRKSGYSRLVEKYPNVELLDLNKAKRRSVAWKYGQLEIPEAIFTHEYINMPSIHSHILVGMSLGLKNQKGLLSAKDRRSFHKNGLNEMIRSLGEAVRPRMNIIDGIESAQGDWPLHTATKRKSKLLVCGDDIFETDRATCVLLGLDPGMIPHIGSGKVSFIEKGMEELSVSFRPADTKGMWNFLRLNIVMDTSICTGCIYLGKEVFSLLAHWPYMAALPYVFLKLAPAFTLGRTYLVAGSLGSSIQKEIEHPCKVICVGDCTTEFAVEHNYFHIQGCPPEPRELLKALLKTSVRDIRRS